MEIYYNNVTGLLTTEYNEWIIEYRKHKVITNMWKGIDCISSSVVEYTDNQYILIIHEPYATSMRFTTFASLHAYLMINITHMPLEVKQVILGLIEHE